MGRFVNSNYKSKDYSKEIDQARSDLEYDYPNARVFIHYADGGSPSVRARPISLIAPDGESNVVRHHIELPGKLWGSYGYDILVFSEGALDYPGKFGSGWTSQSDGARESKGDGIGVKRLEWSRKDGGSKKRQRTSIDAANWMRELDGELYLSQLTIPGTHDSHALIGTPIVPSHDLLDQIGAGIAKATKAGECQEWNIATQLQNGIRYFDFRYGDDMKMRHGQLELPGTVPQCLKVVSDFLDSHPWETVIVMAKWDKWSFPKNDGFPEPDEVRTGVDKAFTDLPRFANITSTPQLKNVRGKIIRKREGNSFQGLDIDAVKRDGRYNRPDFNWPTYKLFPGLSAEQNMWLERSHTIDGVWAEAEHTLNWIRDVRPKAQAHNVWDNTGLNSFRIDLWTILSKSSIFPVDAAKPTNQKLHKWVELNCSLAQRYELGVIQMDFAGSEGTGLLQKLILTNFT